MGVDRLSPDAGSQKADTNYRYTSSTDRLYNITYSRHKVVTIEEEKLNLQDIERQMQ